MPAKYRIKRADYKEDIKRLKVHKAKQQLDVYVYFFVHCYEGVVGACQGIAEHFLGCSRCVSEWLLSDCILAWGKTTHSL